MKLVKVISDDLNSIEKLRPLWTDVSVSRSGVSKDRSIEPEGNKEIYSRQCYDNMNKRYCLRIFFSLNAHYKHSPAEKECYDKQKYADIWSFIRQKGSENNKK